MKELSTYSEQELYERSYHTLDIEQLLKYCDPFSGCWVELKTPITKKEVIDCIKKGEAELVDTPIWTEIAFGRVKLSEEQARQNHIKKIAYFATHDIESPISLDVGIPSLNFYVSHIVDDGNHRLAGAVIRGDTTINAKVGGSLEYAEELGLFNPNEFDKELVRRYDEAEKKKSVRMK